MKGSFGSEMDRRILQQMYPLDGETDWAFSPCLRGSTCLFYAARSFSMYASVRAPVPGVTSYWHNKGMFIHGDESADVTVICDDNLIELSAYWGD